MFDVDFNKSGIKVICHEQYKNLIPRIVEGLAAYDLKDHFVLFSSGTTGGHLKGYAISREALFKNAQAVNNHFNLSHNDVWGLSLPVYHIGGLSVLARANLLNNSVIDVRNWGPLSWLKKIEDVTITTIVPTQLYDLVHQKLTPSKRLRYLIVGGDFLSSTLKAKAMELGWPVIRTFGMSEVSSQMASAKDPLSDDLEILPIHELKTDSDKLLVQSQSLFTLEFILGPDLKVTPASALCNQEGYYVTKDLARIEGNFLRHLGRVGDEVKIAGHLVNINALRDELSGHLLQHGLYNQLDLILEEDERKGKRLVLITQIDLESSQLEAIRKLIFPVKIDEIRRLSQFERTALGKLKKGP